jgi:DNA-binding MarR family transcriptional regulator
MKELNKNVQDLKIGIKILKKSPREATFEMENLGKRSGVTDANITKRIQEIEEKNLKHRSSHRKY